MLKISATLALVLIGVSAAVIGDGLREKDRKTRGVDEGGFRGQGLAHRVAGKQRARTVGSLKARQSAPLLAHKKVSLTKAVSKPLAKSSQPVPARKLHGHEEEHAAASHHESGHKPEHGSSHLEEELEAEDEENELSEQDYELPADSVMKARIGYPDLGLVNLEKGAYLFKIT